MISSSPGTTIGHVFSFGSVKDSLLSPGPFVQSEVTVRNESRIDVVQIKVDVAAAEEVLGTRRVEKYSHMR